MTAVKLQNYSDEQTAQLVAGYKAGEAIEDMAAKLGKSVRSVIAKLSREGVYQKPAKTAGVREELKTNMVSEIADILQVSKDQVESLEKATNPALVLVLKALRQLND